MAPRHGELRSDGAVLHSGRASQVPIPVEQRPPSGSPGLASQEASGAGRGASAAGEGRRQGVLEDGGPPDAEEGKMAAWRSRRNSGRWQDVCGVLRRNTVNCGGISAPNKPERKSIVWGTMTLRLLEDWCRGMDMNPRKALLVPASPRPVM